MKGLIWGFWMGVVEVKKEDLLEEMGLRREERNEDWIMEDMGYEVGETKGFGEETELWVSGFDGEWWWWWWIRGGMRSLDSPTDFCT